MAVALRPWKTFENRCDACGSESWWLFEKVTPAGKALALYFCGHHGNRFEPTLAAQGWVGSSYISQINVKPSVSANAV